MYESLRILRSVIYVSIRLTTGLTQTGGMEVVHKTQVKRLQTVDGDPRVNENYEAQFIIAFPI